MGWRRRWPEREPRPEVQRLSEDQKNRYLRKFNDGIASSPVLSTLNVRVRASRGRFYFDRIWNQDESEIEILGRVTPLAGPVTLLLEAEKSEKNWFKVKQGSAQKIIEALANDTEGTFHGLGALDQSLRKVKGDRPLEIEMRDDRKFFYAKTEKECAVQEVLYHFFGAPIDVIAQPRIWYWYHRTPRIVEVSEDLRKVLVEFSAKSMWCDSFVGRCLYMIKEDAWGAFVIKPNQSGNIESAMSWLEKRKWKDWSE